MYLGAGRLTETLALSKNLSDRFAPEIVNTWLGTYDLGRAYLEAKLYPDAQNEFDVCMKRRGEASAVFLDDNPTLRYLPAVHYFSGLAKAGLNSPDAADDFKMFLGIKQKSERDPMVSDANHRLQSP